MSTGRLLLGAVVCVSLVAFRPCNAQQLRGTVTDSATGLPIPAAVVSLLDSANQPLRRVLSDLRGHFVLTVTAAARRIRVQHIGHLPSETVLPKAGADGAVQVDLALARIPIQLTEVRVRAPTDGRQRCPDRPEEAAAIAQWGQAREALLAASVARSATEAIVRVLFYDRDIDPRTGRVTHQTVVSQSGRSANPTFSARSAEAFAQHGYLDVSATGTLFYGPDVDVLLDDRFTATHCFYPQPSDARHSGEVGIGFLPARETVGMADIAGVLWLDPAAQAIRTLEYRYTNVVSTMSGGALGGMLTFRLLPNGVPLIERWVIRTSAFSWAPPSQIQRTERAASSDGPAAGVANGETGLELLDAVWPDSVRWKSRLGTVAGHVQSAADGKPAPGVRVWLNGTTDAATTDSIGTFMLKDVLPGGYTVRVAEDIFAPFGVEQVHDATVDVLRDSVTTLALVARLGPSAVTTLCGSPPPSGSGDVLARVQAADGSTPRSVDLTAQLDVAVKGKSFRVVKVNDTGSFVACGVPLETAIRLHAASVKLTVDQTIRMQSGGVVDTVTLRLPPPS